jgi:hypothetical protein
MMKNTKNEDIKTVMRIKKVKILSINKHNKKKWKVAVQEKDHLFRDVFVTQKSLIHNTKKN